MNIGSRLMNAFTETPAPEPSSKPVARVCARCRKSGGAFAYAIEIDGEMRSRYLHLRCVKPFIAQQQKKKGGR